jgi:hypothetical protein
MFQLVRLSERLEAPLGWRQPIKATPFTVLRAKTGMSRYGGQFLLNIPPESAIQRNPQASAWLHVSLLT